MTQEEAIRLEVRRAIGHSKHVINVRRGNIRSGGYDDITGWFLGSDGVVDINNTVLHGVNFLGQPIDIPDTTTANSFHISAAGNTWWGATTYAGASTKISNAGVVTLSENLTSGDLWGDGSDGDVVLTNSTLSEEKFYDTCTVGASQTINTGGYRIFCKDILNVAGTLQNNGAAGSKGDNARHEPALPSGGAGGAGGSAGTLMGGEAGGVGGVGGAGTGAAGDGADGTAVSNSIGVSGASGGDGGGWWSSGSLQMAGASGGAAGTATTATLSPTKNEIIGTLLKDVGNVKMTSSAGSAGGGGGEGCYNFHGGNWGAGGGGAGGSGGMIAIYARTINIEATGKIQANGGNGGAGGDGANDGHVSGSGGGGGAGAGGVVVLVYQTLTNNGTVQADGGNGGSTGTNPGGDATPGDAGPDGTIYLIQVSNV